MKQSYIAELIGTFILVSIGSLAALSSDGNLLIVAFGFGLALMIALYSVGHISGGHFNPAVSLAMRLGGSLSTTDMIGYWVAQVVGAILASLAVLAMVGSDAVADTMNKYKDTGPAFGAEILLTGAFVLVIMVVAGHGLGHARTVISLALVAIHLAGIPISGASVNPARSLGPAVVTGKLGGIWLYIVAPLVGAVVAWVVTRVARTGPVDA
ncbi:MAG: aquaporin [bacterium]|nr:aquaporin [bacterium]MDE0601623.1 aquaporin [bacterium]